MKKFVLAVLLAAVALSAPASAATVRLFHDTFDPSYRSPGGAVATGTSVRLRLRVTGPKAQSVTLRVDRSDPVAGTQTRSCVCGV
jgi:hypothetical protein